jgi:hypothetical protein
VSELLDRYWHTPVAAVRPWLLLKATLLLFGLDAFADHLAPAWRYGTAGFNVPHFALLDSLPAPTSAAYVGTIIAIGLACFVCALSARTPRWLVAAIAIAYLWSWSSSMHDSYQHHYLLSLFFLAFVFFPMLSARNLFGSPRDLARTPAPAAAADAPAAPGGGKRKSTKKGAARTDGARGGSPSRAEALLAGQTEGIAGVGLLAAGAALAALRFVNSEQGSGRAFDVFWLGLLAAGLVLSARGSILSERTRALDEALPYGVVPRASAFGLVLIWTTSAIVYSYTAVAKTDPEWLAGDALRNITREGATIPAFIELAGRFGLEGERLWWTLGHSVVLLQICCALGYATASIREFAAAPGGKVRRSVRIALDAVAWIALVLALSFHLGAEYMGLQIGWFSWYMIILAIVTFAPARWLSYVCFYASWPLRALGDRAAREPSPAVAGLFAVGAAAVLFAVGRSVDLPGALEACVVAALGVLAAAVTGLVRRKGIVEVRSAAVALALAALALWGAMETTTQRYDYWRFAGGDFRRRGEWARALEAYLHAERYAPEGQSRSQQIREMRERIAAEGPRRRQD